MNILITICARGGSKGIPGKNIREMAGKPLISYSIGTAQRFASQFDHGSIGLSTDDEKIKEVAQRYGVNTAYKRPDELATDTAGKIGAIKDLLLYEEENSGIRYDYVLDLDVTSPLRTTDDLQKAFEIITADEEADNLFSVNKANRNPYFNMVEKKENGYYGLIKELSGNVLSRQAAPQVYDLNASFYFYRRRFFDKGYNSAITPRSLIYEMPHICFDLDEPVDFEFLEFLMNNNKIEM